MAKRHKSAVKRHRQSVRARTRNRAVKSELRGALKEIKTSPDAKKLSATSALLDKAVKRGVLHKNTAARSKSRLAKMLNKKAQSK